MKEPTLVILAAGLGSRFGGLKQITAVDDCGHPIIDFSMFDAHRAGFKKVAFIIKHEIEEDFKARIGAKAEKFFEVSYVYQELDKLPAGYSVPEGRIKPWGTGHAVSCCQGIVDGPFAVINADDFYGPGAYRALYDFLTEEGPETEHAMVAYLLKNTVTENGYVARGVCTGKDGYLTDVVERTRIEQHGSKICFTEDNGENWEDLSGDTLVSMNCWAFRNGFLDKLVEEFPAWLDENLPVNPEKCEYFLPFVVNDSIKDGSCRVRLLNCSEVWYGMTYREDLPVVTEAIKEMKRCEIYPENW